MSVKDNAVQLKIQSDSIDEKILNVKSENSLVLQMLELPADTKSVHLTATGHGFALFQLSYRYNLNESDIYATFNLIPKVLETTAGHLNVEVCARLVEYYWIYEFRTFFVPNRQFFIPDLIQRRQMRNIQI